MIDTALFIVVGVFAYAGGVITGMVLAFYLLRPAEAPEKCHYCGNALNWPFPYYRGFPICAACLSKPHRKTQGG